MADDKEISMEEVFGNTEWGDDDIPEENINSSSGDVDEAILAEMEALFSQTTPLGNNQNIDLQEELNKEAQENAEESLKEFQENAEEAKNAASSDSEDEKIDILSTIPIFTQGHAANHGLESNVSEPEAVEPEAVEPEVVEPEVKSERVMRAEDQLPPLKSTLNTDLPYDDSYISPTVVDYQRYMLAINELTLPENQESFDAFVEVIADKLGLDPKTATAEDLIKVDAEIANSNLVILEQVAPDVLKASNKKIQDNYDAWELMTSAGIDVANSEIPMGFMEDVQVMAAFDDQFPDENRLPLKERIASMKDDLLGVLKNDNVKIGLATLSFALAVSAGAVTLPLAGALYTAKLMENGKIQSLANTLHSKVSKTLVKLGFKEEAVNERQVLLGDKMKAISESKWGKVAKFGLAAGLVGVGLTAVISATDFSFDKMPQYYASAKEGLSNAASSVSNYASSVFSGDHIPGEDVYASIKETVGSYVNEGKIPGHDLYQEVKNALGMQDGKVLPNADDIFPEVTEDVKVLPNADDIFPEVNAEGEVKLAPHPVFPDEVKTDYIVQPKDSAWNLAEKHFEVVTGEKPTPQQITAIVNDLGLKDPNSIKPGDLIKFDADLSKYNDVTHIKASEAEWLSKATEQHIKASEAEWLSKAIEHASLATTNIGQFSGPVSVGDMYDINHITKGADIDYVKSINKGIDLENLMPGDKVNVPGLEGTSVYTVPDIEDAIVDSIYPGGSPMFLDKDKLFDLVEKANPDVDMNTGVLGMFGNNNLGSDLARQGSLVIPNIDLDALNPQVTGEVTIKGYNSGGQLNRIILDTAYPEGIPDLLDRNEFVQSVKNANPDLRFLDSKEHFQTKITIPNNGPTIIHDVGTNGIVENGSTVSGNASEKAKQSFLDRIVGRNNEHSMS